MGDGGWEGGKWSYIKINKKMRMLREGEEKLLLVKCPRRKGGSERHGVI